MVNRSLVLSLLVGATACVPKKPATSSSKDFASEIPVALGFGYDTDLFSNKEDCIRKEIVVDEGSSTSNFNFERLESLSTKKSSFGFESSLSLSYAIAKGSATAGFATSLDETTFSSTYLLDVTVASRSERTNGVHVDADKVDKNDLAAFRQRCGDKYVSQVIKGGRLLIALTYVFADKASKDSFNSSFSFGFTGVKLGADAKVNLEKAWQDLSKNTSVRITLNQKGGDPGKLRQEFLDGQDVMQCDTENIDKCKETVKKLFNYAVNFPANAAEKPFVYDYKLEPYPGVSNLPSTADPALASIKEATSEKLLETRKQVQMLSDLMRTPSGYGTDSRKQAMGAAKINLEKNREKLQTNIIRCVESNNNCRDLEQLGLIAIDESLLVTSGDLANIGAIGGLGGGEVVQKCGDYVTGVHGESGWILDRAGTVCSDGKRLPQLGKNQSTAFEARCPAGQVVVGIQGRREPYKKTTAVGSLVLECMPLDKVRANDQNVTEVVAFSGEESRDIKRRCDPGQAAKEVVFRSGFWIDSISLNCVKVY